MFHEIHTFILCSNVDMVNMNVLYIPFIPKFTPIPVCFIRLLFFIRFGSTRSMYLPSPKLPVLCWCEVILGGEYLTSFNLVFQVVMMLVIVVILFAVCWTPLLVNNVLVAFGYLDNLNMGFLKHIRIPIHILAYANSCINPFVYAFMSKNFRDGFKQSISACLRRGAYHTRSTHISARSVTSSTRASTSNGDRITNSIALRRASEL